MIIGYKLTLEQADELRGKEFAPDNYFNPVQDINGDWFIFEVEYQHTDFNIEPSEYEPMLSE